MRPVCGVGTMMHMPASMSDSPGPCVDPGYWNPETMSGTLTLVGPNRRSQDVQVKVYRTSLEHFAVLYPNKKVCRPLGVINLRNTQVERLNTKEPGFLVRQRGFDSPCSVTFVSESHGDVDMWMRAFSSTSPNTTTASSSSSSSSATTKRNSLVHQSSLPIVEEEEG